MKHLLVLTNSQDVHVDKFMEVAGYPEDFLRVDSDRFSDTTSLTIDDTDIQLVVDGRSVPYEEIGAIWVRKPFQWWFELSQDFKKLDPNTQEVLRFKRMQVTHLLNSYLYEAQLHGIQLINDPFLDSTQFAKPNQLKIAREIGMDVPKTLITTDKTRIREFLAPSDGKSIIKTVGTIGARHDILAPRVAMTHEITLADYKRYLSSNTIQFPSILQAAIYPKTDIRVTCIGETMFSAAMEATGPQHDNIDVRVIDTEKTVFTVVTLPTDIVAKIRNLNDRLGLTYAAVDLALDKKSGTYFFLEVNPHGQYYYIEESTGQPITAALIDYFRARLKLA